MRGHGEERAIVMPRGSIAHQVVAHVEEDVVGIEADQLRKNRGQSMTDLYRTQWSYVRYRTDFGNS